MLSEGNIVVKRKLLDAGKGMDAKDEYNRIIGGLKDNLELLIASGVTHIPVPRPKESIEETRAPGGLKERVLECALCGASVSARKVASGAGNRGAKLVFVGGAPTEQDALKGEPFTGQEGELLTRMMEAMGFKKKDVYILNSVRCASTGEPVDVVSSCRKFLEEELETLSPRVLVALGPTAALSLLGDSNIGGLRGRFHEYLGIKVMATYGTAELIKDPALKKAAWEDLKLVIRELEGG